MQPPPLRERKLNRAVTSLPALAAGAGAFAGAAAGYALLMGYSAGAGYLAYLGHWWKALVYLMGAGYLGIAWRAWALFEFRLPRFGMIAGLVFTGACALVFFGVFDWAESSQLAGHGRAEPAVVSSTWVDEVPESDGNGGTSYVDVYYCSFSDLRHQPIWGRDSGTDCQDVEEGQRVTVTMDPQRKANPVIGRAPSPAGAEATTVAGLVTAAVVAAPLAAVMAAGARRATARKLSGKRKAQAQRGQRGS